MAGRGEEYNQELMRACMESENPVEFFRSVARNGAIGFDEFRLILQTPFQLFLQTTISNLMANVPAALPGLGQVQELASQSVHSLQLHSDLILRQLFKFLDRDGDGQIKEQEFVEALTMLSRRDFRSLFNVLDLNGDGFVTEDEIMAFVKDASECLLGLADSILDVFSDTILFQSDVIKNALTLVWMFIDADGDGAITSEDLLNLIPPPVSAAVEMQFDMLQHMPGPLGGELFSVIIESESSMRKKFEDAMAKSPDGHVSEATMFSLVLNSTRDSLRNQLPAQMELAFAGAPPQFQNEEFRNVAMSLVPEILERKFPSYFWAIFKLLDKDGDGRISQAEFDAMYAVLEAFKPEASGDRVKVLLDGVLQIFDVNLNGKVTVEEADEVIKKILMIVREVIHISLAVMKEVALKVIETEPVKMFIAMVDTNGDGKISLAEFQEHLARNSPIPRAMAALLGVEATPTPPVNLPNPFLASGDNANL